MTTYTIKRHDLYPPIEATLEQADGVPINLRKATQVRFMMLDEDDNLKVDAPVQIIDAARGVVLYDWQAGDTDTSGTYRAEFEITFEDGRILTVPNDDYIIIIVMDDLG